jgi:glucose-6-phosphate isomerase
MASRKLLNELTIWDELAAEAAELSGTSITDLFASDPVRHTEFVTQAAGLTLDYSKHLISRKARQLLVQLAQEAELPTRIRSLLSGEHINTTEQRPALHSLLRAPAAPPGLEDKYREVAATRERMRHWADRLNRGEHLGFDGSVITDVVNIGIGGSDLGPRLVTEALRPYHGNVACHYVANVDPADIQGTLLDLDPARTLFIVCSKSFRTEETLTNSLAAREWMLNAGARPQDLDRHFLAITTNLAAAAEFGIPDSQCLPLWDWVGGRYSVWSAIGLSCAVAVGWENFAGLLDGAAGMDQHFAEAEPGANMPVLMSLLEVWYGNCLGAGNHVVLPYDHALRKLPDFLQQLTMESNGKRVSEQGAALDYPTGPVLWGSAGTMGQHSFHQLLHQGTRLCPADFVLPLTTHTGMSAQHRRLVANCLAQSRTMMVGRTQPEARQALLERGASPEEAEQLAPHLAMPGNRPNSVITLPALTPGSLGALLALYEHRTFCSGQLWGLNPFDQWGVELGKEIGVQILGRLGGDEQAGTMDAATERLISAWQQAREDAT